MCIVLLDELDLSLSLGGRERKGCGVSYSIPVNCIRSPWKLDELYVRVSLCTYAVYRYT